MRFLFNLSRYRRDGKWLCKNIHKRGCGIINIYYPSAIWSLVFHIMFPTLNQIPVLPHVLPCESSCALALHCWREWRQLCSDPWPLDGFIKPDLVVVRWFTPPKKEKKMNAHLYQTQPPTFGSTSALFDPVPRLSLELSLFTYYFRRVLISHCNWTAIV